MIIICEPLCKGISHEKCNSGFISGLRLAFPGEGIRLYADATHIKAIKKILEHDKVNVDPIEYCPQYFTEGSFVVSLAFYCFNFYRIFSSVIRLGEGRVFFLSFSPEILYVIKMLKIWMRFAHLNFAFVLHGAFETIDENFPLLRAIALPINTIPDVAKAGLLERLRGKKIIDLPLIILLTIAKRIPRISRPQILNRFFTVKIMMAWKHTPSYRYIALSPHITRNAARYIDIQQYDFYTIILPTNFVVPTEAPINAHVKFAIFGYGDSLVLHNIAYLLTQRQIAKPWEIRVIGMDNRGTEGFVSVTCTSGGKRLERDEMELHAKDIDAFLILHDKTKYRLSCSGSILETLSMCKPIIHFDNDCINEFNKVEKPIGFRCYTLDEYINKLVDIIENYDLYQSTFADFRKNIFKVRGECAINKSMPKIMESFTW